MDDKVTDLAKEFLKLKTKKELVDFLYGLFTPSELITLSTRLSIVRMLKKGIPQHEIAKILGIGVGTVTHGSLELKKGRFKNISPSWRLPLKGR